MTARAARAAARPATLEFRAMNTDWWLSASGGVDLRQAEATVHEAETVLSRFRPDSALTVLNRDRESSHPWLAAVVQRGLELEGITLGAFDVRVGAALLAAGYDRTFEELAGRPPALPPTGVAVDGPLVTVEGERVRLAGPGLLDLGGIAKGWTVDLAAGLLAAAGADHYLVDGGGDIRGCGVGTDGTPWAVGVGDGLAVALDGAAVATSSTARRCWRNEDGAAHHVIDPRSGLPSRGGVRTATVVAADTATADALATAIVAQPRLGLAGLAALGADALLDQDDHWVMTPGMERWLK